MQYRKIEKVMEAIKMVTSFLLNSSINI